MSRGRSTGVAVLLACAALGLLATRGAAQTPPPSLTLPGDTTTTTTATTAPPSSEPPSTDSSADGGSPSTGAGAPSPDGGGSSTTPADGGDNSSPVGGGPGQVVPPDAQAILDSMVRSAPNDDHLLVAGEKALLAAGVDPDRAARLAYGNFPVAGPAHWVDDWHAARFTGTTFRWHEGIDLVADYGTPLRAPADGTAMIEDSPAGGLAVKVVRPDGTFFYLAHMSATADGLTNGTPVHTGDLIGYVGQSGDATGPHCHFGLYQGGTTPVSPKPLLDQWVADTAARLPGIIASITGGTPRPLVATGIVRQLTDDSVRAAETPAGPSRTELLFATSANPSGGALQLAQASAAQSVEGVDWVRRASVAAAYQRAWDQATARAWQILGPLTPPALRPPS